MQKRKSIYAGLLVLEHAYHLDSTQLLVQLKTYLFSHYKLVRLKTILAAAT
jgi:hypothetical protein